MLRWLAAAVALLVGLGLVSVGNVRAAEQRLRVVNVSQDTFWYYVGFDRSFARLAEAIEGRTIPLGVILYDRRLGPAPPGVAKAFDAVTLTEDRLRFEGETFPEVRWEGTPGERALFAVRTHSIRFGELRDVALGRGGALRHSIPYGVTGTVKAPALKLPLGILYRWEGEPGAARPTLDRHLDLVDGLGVIAGVHGGSLEADTVFIVVEHPREPATFSVVLSWKRRPAERESASLNDRSP